jgi:hypothetical protein
MSPVLHKCTLYALEENSSSSVVVNYDEILRYCLQKFQNSGPERSRYTRDRTQNMSPHPTYSILHSYQDVTMDALRAFVGVLMNMFLTEKAKMKDYFSESWVERMAFFKYFGCFTCARLAFHENR